MQPHRQTERPRHLCRGCGTRRAVFVFRGRWRACRQHDLCPRCWQSVEDQLRANQLAEDGVPDAQAA